MATSLAPILTQLFDDYGEVLAGGFIYTYEAGTDTPLATYTDLAGAVPNANPVELDASGRATVRVTDGVFEFETTGGGAVSCVYGDEITFHAPDSGSAANILATLVGELV